MADKQGYSRALTAGRSILQTFIDNGNGTWSRASAPPTGTVQIGYTRAIDASGKPIPIRFVVQGATAAEGVT